MNAHELLATIEARGGNVAVALDATGASKIQISPRGLVADLLPDLQRFKPALLELLNSPTVTPGRAEMGVCIAAQWQRTFTPAEIEEYNRAVSALDSGQEPQEIHQ